MWSKSYSTTVSDLTADQVWAVWQDVNQWHTWQEDIDYARMDGEFVTGGKFEFKPAGGPRLQLELTEVRENSRYVDLTRLPLARMYDIHELHARDSGLEITTTIRIEGPLAFLWRKLVAEGVADGAQRQTDSLIARARHG